MKKNHKIIATGLLTLAALSIAVVIFSRQGGSQKQAPETPGNHLTEEMVAEINEVFTKIDTAKDIYLQGRYELFDNRLNKLMEQEPFILAKYNGISYFMVGHIEQITMNDKGAFINNNEKTIVATVKKMEGNATKSILSTVSGFRDFINLSNNNKVNLVANGQYKEIRMELDSTMLHKTAVIRYEATTKKLKSTSTVATVADAGSNENADKQILLKLTIDDYQDDFSTVHHWHLFKKISWERKKINVTDSLKQYTIQYTE